MYLHLLGMLYVFIACVHSWDGGTCLLVGAGVDRIDVQQLGHLALTNLAFLIIEMEGML